MSKQSPRTKKAATAQNGESILTNAASDLQLPTAPDGAAAGTAPVAAGAEASTTLSQSVTAAEIQLATPAPTDGTFAIAKVPVPTAPAVQRPIVPLPANQALVFLGVKPDIKDMTLDEKFACLKQCFAYGYGVRKVLCEVFEAIRTEFKTYVKDREGLPTVEEAFKLRGLNYHTIYSAIQREKDRRAEDAQFFAAIKAEQSTKNVHGVDITDDDVPVGTQVVLSDGTKGQVLTAGEKKAPDSEPSLEVVTEEGTAVQVKRGELITLAEKEAAKAAAKAAKKAAKNTPEARKEADEKETARIAAAVAEEDVSSDIEALMQNVNVDAGQAYCVVELNQSHELKYTAGKRKHEHDFSLAEDNGNATHEDYEVLVKEDKVIWTHRVTEVSGSITITVENEDGTLTEKQLVSALREKMTATLKSMRIWSDNLTKEFKDHVEETINWREHQKEGRSESAKRAAETRKEKKEAVQAIKDRVAAENAKKVKKLTQRKTTCAIGDAIRNVRGKDDGSIKAWADILAVFKAAVVAHPEWHSVPVRLKREMLERIFVSRQEDEAESLAHYAKPEGVFPPVPEECSTPDCEEQHPVEEPQAAPTGRKPRRMWIPSETGMHIKLTKSQDFVGTVFGSGDMWTEESLTGNGLPADAAQCLKFSGRSLTFHTRKPGWEKVAGYLLYELVVAAEGYERDAPDPTQGDVKERKEARELHRQFLGRAEAARNLAEKIKAILPKREEPHPEVDAMEKTLAATAAVDGADVPKACDNEGAV